MLDGGHDAFGILVFKSEFFPYLGADRDEDRIELLRYLREFRSIHTMPQLDFDIARRQDAPDVLIEALSREAIRRNGIAHHAAELLMRFIHNDFMPHKRQKVRAGQSAGSTSDDGDPTIGGCKRFRRGHRVGRCLVDRITLDAADIDGGIQNFAAARALAGMLAYECACRRERVVLADHVDGARVVSPLRQRDIGWNIHMGRTERFTGDGLPHPFGT